jgi:wobble nucleotide-excising tRNase
MIDQIDSISKSDNNFIDIEKIIHLGTLIKSKYDENLLLIEKKKKEPSRSIKLVKFSDTIKEINLEILSANKEIHEFNTLIDNARVEKEKLTKDIWRFIGEKNKNNFSLFNRKKSIVEKTLTGLEATREKKNKFKIEFEKELMKLQEDTTSVEHSVSEINKTLCSFGFKNFKLATATKKGYYKIIRENGEEAKDTLSEGEKTFITFLYFYQLLKGSNNKEDINTEKVVVIDDPISSLDSNVLFMVSSLVRQIMFAIKEKTTEIKQLFVLTHNVYFYKEITFNKGSKRYGQGGFWIVRKSDNITSIAAYEENPIKTSYELLWKELKTKESQSLTSIQNIMRRILENYFKFLGNIDLDSLEDKFDHEDRLLCRSLISWINDGSHYINEDLYVENPQDVVNKYFLVFKEIFRNQGQIEHFYMMMGERDKEFPTLSKEIKQEETIESLGVINAAMQEAASGNES